MSPSLAMLGPATELRLWKKTWSSTSQTTWGRCLQKRSATRRWGSMASAIGPMSGGLVQFLMIATQSSKNARGGDWTHIQSTLSKKAMIGLVVGKPLLKQWVRTCRSKPPSEAWQRCLEKHHLQMGWKSPLKPNRLGKAAHKRLEKACKGKGLEKPEEPKAKWLRKACWSAWMGLHACFCSNNVCFLTNKCIIISMLFSMKSSPWHASTNELGKAPACSTGTRHTRGCKFTSWHIYINLTLLNSRNIYLSNECCSSAASKVPGAVWTQQ